MSKKNNDQVEEVKVETTEKTDVKIEQAKEAGKNFGKKVWNFGKKALPVVAAFGVGVGACLVAGAISNKKSSSDDEIADATDEDSSWDETLEDVKE